MSRRFLAPAVGIVVFLGVWEAFVRIFHVRKFVLRAPSAALRHLWNTRSTFLEAGWITVQHAGVGLLISLTIGVLVGAVLAASPFLEHATQPVLTLVQVAPWFAYVSSVVLWLGSGTPPALFMVGLVCLPAYVFATVDGMRSVEPATLELFRSVDAGRWEVLWRLRLPSAAPVLFTTSRFNLGLALAAAYYVEGANLSNEGIGAIGRRASAAASGADTLWAAVFAMAILGVLGLLLISLLQHVVLHWHAAHRTRPA
ncbi:MAG: ABC transporter permease subunit [Acidimicrobiaceae bacterium]|nr:ABC transporter permease subunit [Ilumatobacter sp.]MCB9379607.1 ABC transporter permease subunit [Acidimicrobiaceae bacterium]MCO5332071.1 ABC transporter permease subunit [Ilumatobacteraceae bacterium]